MSLRFLEENEMGAIVKSGYSLVNQAMSYGNEIKKSPDATENAIRFAGFAALGIAQATAPTVFLNNISVKLVDNADFLCSIQIFQNLNYWVNGGWKQGDLIPKFANAAFSGATASCFALLLDQWKFIEVSQLAASIGSKVPLLQPLTNLSALVFIRGQLAIGFALLDVHNLWNGYDSWCAKSAAEVEVARINSQITQQGTTPLLQTELAKAQAKLDLASLKLKQNMIDVAQFTSQIALNVLCISGYATASPVIIGFGLVSYGLAIVSFLNNTSNKKTIEDLKNTIGPHHPLNPDHIRLYSSPDLLSPSHWIDFAGRIVSKYEGLDTVCKFGTGGVDFYEKFWDKPSTSFVLAKDSLDANVSWNKFTNLVPRTQKVMQQICEGKANFKETINSTCMLAVTFFESYAWYAGMSDLGKMSSAFKAWKNGFFVTGLAAGITKESFDLDKWDQKKAVAALRVNYWNRHPLLNCTGTDQIRDHYAGKIASSTDQAKRVKWQDRINTINALPAEKHLEYVATYNKHLTKKKDDWSEIEKYAEVSKKSAENFRRNAFIKMISLGVDLAVITLTVQQVTTVIIPVIGLQFAAIARAKQVFAAVNLTLGTLSMYAIHYSEYEVQDRKALLITERHIKPAKLEVKR